MKKYIMLSVICLLLVCNVSPYSCFAFDMDSIKIHGFLSQGYLQTDHNNFMAETEDGTFQFNEFGLNFTTRLSDNLTTGIQFFGRDMGSIGNDEIKVDWAYLDYRWRDWAGLRVGMSKMVYGLYNETRELDMLRTSVILPQSVYVETYRDSNVSVKGFDFYGYLPVKHMGDFSYEFQYGLLPFKNGDGVSQSIESANFSNTLKVESLDSDSAYAYALTWEPPLEGLKLRYSGFEVNGLIAKGRTPFKTLPGDANHDGVISPGETVPADTFVVDFKLVRFSIASCEYTFKDLVLAAEYMEMDLRRTVTLGSSTAYNFPYQGWYLSGSYRFNPLFSLGLSYSEFYPNAKDKDGDKLVATGKKDFQAWQKTYTVSTKFDINQFWLFKLEASYNDGFGAVQPVYNDPAKLEPYWWLFAAKATVSF